MIKIPSRQKAAIENFIRDLEKSINPLLWDPKNGYNDVPNILSEINEICYRWQEKIAKNITILFIWEKSNDVAKYQLDEKTILINLRVFSSVKSGKGMGDYRIQRIYYNRIKSVLYHEIVHHHQNLKSQKKSKKTIDVKDGYNKKMLSYFSHPWEQQAWAVQSVEEIKNGLKMTDPKEILKYLKDWAFIHSPSLQTLKIEDYNSWKRIMKNAIMYVVADLRGIK